MHKKQRRAFSLFEISIVILIIAVLIGLVTSGARVMSAHRIYTARALTRSGPVTTIPNLVFWIDASAEGVLTNRNGSLEISNNDTIKSWKEPAYLTRDRVSCTESTQANQPSYILNGLNGLPVVRFDSNGSGSMKLSCNVMGGISTENTIFTVFRWVSSNASYGNSNFFVLFGTGSIQSLNSIDTAGVFTFSNWNGSDVDILTTNVTVGQNNIMTRVSNPTTNVSTLYANGSSIATATATMDGTYSTPDTSISITLGNFPSETRTFGGDIAEIIMYDRALNNEERQAVEKYLSKKWAIQLN